MPSVANAAPRVGLLTVVFFTGNREAADAPSGYLRSKAAGEAALQAAGLEIEQAVEHLPEADFQSFAHWFDETRAQRVDTAFEKAILAGQFDAMAAQALRDMDTGRSTPLDEFLRRA